ncbi:MAG: hypothetical protein HQL67_00765 [Magnetococcales bacterium]|nr:hypothetical protein [Magnetococcales bacterium]
MSKKQPTENREKKPATLQIAVAAMATLVPLYIVLGWVMTHSNEAVYGPQGTHALDDLFAYPIAVISLVAPLLAAWQMDRKTVQSLVQMSPPLSPESQMRKLMERRMIAFALRLAPGVTGLGLTILRMEFLWVGILGGIALVAMAMTWPSTALLQKTLNEINAAKTKK